MAATPFAPGNRILDRRDPYEAWTVIAVEPGNMVRCTLPTLPGLSPIVTIAPAEDYALAPEGWQDAPTMPALFIRDGLSYEAHEAARDLENADPNHQREWLRWHLAMAEWCRDVLALRDRQRANEERAQHLIRAEVFQQQIESLSALPIAAE